MLLILHRKRLENREKPLILSRDLHQSRQRNCLDYAKLQNPPNPEARIGLTNATARVPYQGGKKRLCLA
jgi:hypothetical protein